MKKGWIYVLSSAAVPLHKRVTLRMQARGTRSLFARFHNYDAVSEIFRHMETRRVFRAPLKVS